jgi:hypothetical protein
MKPFNFSGSVWVVLIYLYWLIGAAVHIVLAIGVYRDAKYLQKELNRPPAFVTGEMWAFATLIGGVVAAGIYWVIHHSALRPPETKQ